MKETHVVQTAVALDQDRHLYRFGTGYVIADGFVLTAAHVLAPSERTGGCLGQQVQIAPIGGDWLDSVIAWIDSGRDVAVLSCSSLSASSPTHWGRLAGTKAVDWDATGFPAASARNDSERRVEHVYGRVSPVSERSAGCLALTIESREARRGQSPWAGLSGAAVFCGEYLVGVIIADSGAYAKSLEARRISDFFADPELTALLGGVPGLAEVSDISSEASSLSQLVTRRRVPSSKQASEDLAQIADLVAAGIYRDWSYEAAWRHLDDPYAMSVKWGLIDSDLVVSWSSLVRLADTGSGWPNQVSDLPSDMPDLSGSDNDLIRILDLIPTRRLVIVGVPGAGKTVLLVRLILDLLARRGQGEPVPVILPMASWNVLEEQLYDWIERWLLENKPALAVSAPNLPGVSRARALLDERLILPMLDGLDELPSSLRSRAISGINNAMLPGQGLVLASRDEAFRDAVQKDVRLAGAAGIKIYPLNKNTVFSYLQDSAGSVQAADRWTPLAAAADEDSSIPVSTALTTPLMAAMARAIYNLRPGENLSTAHPSPSELLDQPSFPTAKDIEQHLFDAFIPAAYRSHPDPLRRPKWTPQKAIIWLRFLASDLEHQQHHATDFAWWQLAGASWGSFTGVICGILAAIAGTLGYPYVALGPGLLVLTAAIALLRPPVPSGRSAIGMGLGGGLLGGQAGALIGISLFGTGNGYLVADLGGGIAFAFAVAPFGDLPRGMLAAFAGQIASIFFQQSSQLTQVRDSLGVAAHIVDGIGIGLLVLLVVQSRGRIIPARALRWSGVGLIISGTCGVVLGAVAWIKAGPAAGIACCLIFTLGGAIAGGLYGTAAETDLDQAVDPRDVLSHDRMIFLICLGLSIPVGICAILLNELGRNQIPGNPGFWQGIGVGLADIVVVGIALAFMQAAWGRYTIVRIWLAINGSLPWRLTSFLRDAHEGRGVLRRVGAHYQFRHIEIQRCLVNSANSAAQD